MKWWMVWIILFAVVFLVVVLPPPYSNIIAILSFLGLSYFAIRAWYETTPLVAIVIIIIMALIIIVPIIAFGIKDFFRLILFSSFKDMVR